MRYLFLVLIALPLLAERVTVPLRDPSRPASLKVHLVNGDVQVKAHNAKDVVVELDDSGPSMQNAPNGMKRIMAGHGDVQIEEENNNVTVKPSHRSGPIVVYVPEGSSVNIKSVNAKELRVEGISGEINAETVNGSIVISDASGPVVAHALNGRLTVIMKQIPAGKPMSFSTLNGKIDLTVPASAKADLKITNQRGETYSDFDLDIRTSVSRKESGRDSGPKYKLSLERTIVGQINGGGPEIALRSMNGTIYIRKAK